MKTIGLIGGGNMGEAIIAGTHQKYKVSVCEANTGRVNYLKKKYRVAATDLSVLVGKSDVVIMAVKPQDFIGVLNQLADENLKGKLIVSIAAGITVTLIEEHLGRGVKVVRTMPNMPALIGEGMTALSKGKFASGRDLNTAVNLFKNIGQTIVVQEKWIDAVTAVSGSGPAYVFLFVECLMNAARKLGFNDRQARQLVYQTLLGSAHILEKTDEDAALLRAKVTSKGGTTQAAMDVFMAHGIQDIFQKALNAARARARELAK